MGAHTRLLVPLADITAILADPRHRELVVQEDLHPLHQQLTAGLQVIQVIYVYVTYIGSRGIFIYIQMVK